MFSQIAIDDPYPFYAALRDKGPVVWSEEFAGGAWLISTHAAVTAALRDPGLSVGRSDRLVGQFPPEHQTEFSAFNGAFSRWMLFLDPPQHTNLRKLMNQGFKPSTLALFRPHIERTVHSLLDQMLARDSIDFMRDFAHPLPALVIADMLGIDAKDRNSFIKWSDDIAAFFGNAVSSLEVARSAQESLAALTDYFRALLPARRRNMGSDLVSLLIRAEEAGVMLNEEDLLAQCSLLLFAGHETTRNLLGNGLRALLLHRRQWEMLERDRSLLPSAVKELLRYDSPVQCTARKVLKDSVLHDCSLKAGQPVIALIGSANHDPAVFTRPGTLDVTRKEGSHLSFGFGPHVCIGAALTYLEAEVAFGALLERMPELALVDERPDWGSNFAFRGLRSLTLTRAKSAHHPLAHHKVDRQDSENTR